MKQRDLWWLGLKSITTAPMRSLLTVLGMAIGIGAILAVLTLGDAGKNQVEQEMMRLGIDKVWLTAAEGSRLRQGDAALLAEALRTEATEQGYLPVQARHGTVSAEAIAVGCQPAYLELTDARLTAGRWLRPAEWLRGARVALVSEELAEALGLSFREEPPPRLALGGQLFDVAGSVRQTNQLTQLEEPCQVFVPIAVYGELAGDAVHELTLSVPKGRQPNDVAEDAVAALALRGGRQARAVTMQLQIDAANSVLTIFVDVLAWVAVICILVGGIGVMNILLVSVRERRREIGVMKAMGSTGGQICRLFLLEALVYAAIGGVAGILAGLGIIRLAAATIGLSPVVRGEDVVTVAAAAAAVGLFFGVAPALKASRLTPVEALRD